MKPENKILAHNIKLLRKIHGGTQNDFANEYETNQKNINAYENGYQKPKSEFLLKVSKKTGIGAEILLSTKLVVDRSSGKIINLPNKEQQIQEMRSQLKKMIKDFEVAQKAFFSGLYKLTERLDAIEKQVKK